MARTGRPPVPIEIKRRRGTDRADRSRQSTEVVVLPMARGVPDPPPELGLAGRQAWGECWAEGITWISPASDLSTVREACMLVDDVAIARERFRATHEPADLRALIAASGMMGAKFSALGFDPVARTRLGVAEVKKQNALEDLISRRTADK